MQEKEVIIMIKTYQQSGMRADTYPLYVALHARTEQEKVKALSTTIPNDPKLDLSTGKIVFKFK